MKPLALLHGKRVYVHVAEAAKKGPSSGNGGALRRLVAALGGKVRPLATVSCIDCCKPSICMPGLSTATFISQAFCGYGVDGVL